MYCQALGDAFVLQYCILDQYNTVIYTGAVFLCMREEGTGAVLLCMRKEGRYSISMHEEGRQGDQQSEY